jgi:amphi-Trp domain-containing protein
MDIFEMEQKETLTREQAAERMHQIADMLARHNEIELERGGMRIKVNVPDEVQFKFEVEVESDEKEIEIELTWS